jgi:cell filamentation protein
MPYSTSGDPYTSDTGILKNLFNIESADILDNIEEEITYSQIGLISIDSVSGKFDAIHLKAVHKHIFGDIFAWAGEFRTVEILKESTRFASSDVLEMAAVNLFDQLKKDNYLIGLSNEDFATKFAHYYSDLNVLHPFREGNGRTQRAFFLLLAEYADKNIAWDAMDIDENLAASIVAYNGDETRLAKMFLDLLRPNE